MLFLSLSRVQMVDSQLRYDPGGVLSFSLFQTLLLEFFPLLHTELYKEIESAIDFQSKRPKISDALFSMLYCLLDYLINLPATLWGFAKTYSTQTYEIKTTDIAYAVQIPKSLSSFPYSSVLLQQLYNTNAVRFFVVYWGQFHQHFTSSF